MLKAEKARRDNAAESGSNFFHKRKTNQKKPDKNDNKILSFDVVKSASPSSDEGEMVQTFNGDWSRLDPQNHMHKQFYGSQKQIGNQQPR